MKHFCLFNTLLSIVGILMIGGAIGFSFLYQHDAEKHKDEYTTVMMNFVSVRTHTQRCSKVDNCQCESSATHSCSYVSPVDDEYKCYGECCEEQDYNHCYPLGDKIKCTTRTRCIQTEICDVRIDTCFKVSALYKYSYNKREYFHREEVDCDWGTGQCWTPEETLEKWIEKENPSKILDNRPDYENIGLIVVIAIFGLSFLIVCCIMTTFCWKHWSVRESATIENNIVPTKTTI